MSFVSLLDLELRRKEGSDMGEHQQTSPSPWFFGDKDRCDCHSGSMPSLSLLSGRSKFHSGIAENKQTESTFQVDKVDPRDESTKIELRRGTNWGNPRIRP